MIKLKHFSLLVLISASVLSLNLAYAQAAAELKASSTIYTQEKTNIVLSKNQKTFTIKLKSNPTTGYSWMLREYDADLLVPTGHHFEASQSGLMGAGGYDWWTFKVKSIALQFPHQTTIRMIYARPWQGAEGSTPVVFHVSTT